MQLTRHTSDHEEPLVRFKPTTGTYVGWAGLALAVGAAVWMAVSVHSVGGLRVGVGAVFMGVVVWVTQVRPRVTAYPSTLLMRGSLRDTWVPYVLIDEVTMGQTLNVWVGRRRYVCIGIGRSIGADTRQKMRASGQGLFGTHKLASLGGAPAPQRAMSYHSFVLTRITDLVAAARRHRDPDHLPEVRHSFAVPELAALVVSGLAFVVTLLA